MLPKKLKPYHLDKSNLIRIGPKKDGGYVIDKRVIDNTDIIITCGLNDDWEFEKDFINKNKNSRIEAYDHTVDSKFWLKRLKKDLISFLKLKKNTPNKILDIFKYLGYLSFFRGKNKHYIKKIVSQKEDENKQVTLSEAIGNNNNILLKIDIEGDEFKILSEINENIDRINLLIIEFHNLCLPQNLKQVENFIENTVLKNIHINANNYAMVDKNGIPQVIEMTFINPKRFEITNKITERTYPIQGLDFKKYNMVIDLILNFDDDILKHAYVFDFYENKN